MPSAAGRASLKLGRRCQMATFPHEPTRELRSDRELRLIMHDIFASLAISMMWLAVLLDSLFGPDIVSNDGSRVPSGVALALFACLGTWAVAHYAFRREP
jgi:hypothetical protein